MALTVTNVTFEPLDASRNGLRFAAIIETESIEARAMPLIVRFGDVQAAHLTGLPAKNGVRATFSELPDEGATLQIGYFDEGLTTTEFEFHNPPTPPIA